MAGGKRASKRQRTEVPPESSSRKRSAKRRKEQPQEPPPTHAEDEVPSGFPFYDGEVKWTYKRLSLVDKPTKVIPTGYETMAGDVNTVLKTRLSEIEANKVKNSVMGIFTKLDDFTTRSGKMLHYVMCHQVVPNPDFDPTSVFFKIGDTILRFSRTEYALISGLNSCVKIHGFFEFFLSWF